MFATNTRVEPPARMDLRDTSTSIFTVRVCTGTECASSNLCIRGTDRKEIQPPFILLLRLSIICIFAEACGHGALQIATLPSFMLKLPLPIYCSRTLGTRPFFAEAANLIAPLHKEFGKAVRLLGAREIAGNFFAPGDRGTVEEVKLTQDEGKKQKGEANQLLLSQGDRKTEYSDIPGGKKNFIHELPETERFSTKKHDREKRLRERVHELLADSSEFRKLQVQKMEKHLQNAYAAESGMVNPEESQAWKEATAKYKNLKQQLQYLDVSAAASSVFGATGLLGLLLNKGGRGFLPASERRQHVRGSAGLGALGMLGAVALGLTFLARRGRKKQLKATENRLLRIENEAFAGILPSETPVLGLEEYGEEEKLRRKREKRKQLEEEK